MKKTASIILALALVMLTAISAGCSSGQESTVDIVCTVFPVYDWMRELTADSENVNLTLLADNGVDMHSYQPSADDIVMLSTCDMLVYVGGESDEWVDEVLAQAVNRDMTVIDLLDALGDRALETSPHEHEEGEEHDHACVYDEHIWLSPINAQQLCGTLAEALSVLDPDQSELYADNAARYCAELAALDARYADMAAAAEVNTLLFADRFPFRYLTADYGIEYYAAFDGCSAETEAGFDTVAMLSDALDKHGLGCVLIIEGSDDSLARTVINGSDDSERQILTVDSMQSVTAEDILGGVTYLSVMEENLQVLTKALGAE